MGKNLDVYYTRMSRAILSRSWSQHPTKQQLYSHLPPITKTIKDSRTRHAGSCWRSRNELIGDELLWTPSHERAKAGRPARTYIQQLCVERIVTLKTCRKQWTIGKSSERGSEISVPMIWSIYINKYEYINVVRLIYKYIFFFCLFIFIKKFSILKVLKFLEITISRFFFSFLKLKINVNE